MPSAFDLINQSIQSGKVKMPGNQRLNEADTIYNQTPYKEQSREWFGGGNFKPPSYMYDPSYRPEVPSSGLPTDPTEAFNQVSQLPQEGSLMLNPADYTTAIPDVLQQQSQQGYGQQWMSDVFSGYLADQGKQYGRAMDVNQLAGIRSGFEESGVAKQAGADIQYEYGRGAAGAYGEISGQNEAQKLAAQQQVNAMQLSNQGITQDVNMQNDYYMRAIQQAQAAGTSGMADWLSNWNQDVTGMQNQQQQFDWGNQMQQAQFAKQMEYMQSGLQRQLDAGKQDKGSPEDILLAAGAVPGVGPFALGAYAGAKAGKWLANKFGG